MIFLPGISKAIEIKTDGAHINDERKADWQKCRDWQGEIVERVWKWLDKNME